MKNEEKVISLGDLFRILMKRLWIVVIAAVVAFGACFVYLEMTYSERYTSTSSLFVSHPESGLSASSTTHYYEATVNAVTDCAELMTSRKVLNPIIEELGLKEQGIGYGSLKSMISVGNVENSHFIMVSVTSHDAMLSKQIVDKLCEKGARTIEEYIEFATAKVVDEGTYNPHPSNGVSLSLPIVAGIAAAFLAFGVFVVLAVIDDKINGEDDVQNRLGLSVLGNIPYMEHEKNDKAYGYGGEADETNQA
ncbi:MAG: hypothetical protein IJW79_04355 [Clostridia bacterium]|nr:hypothetical protein [Clostridia bacterium]